MKNFITQFRIGFDPYGLVLFFLIMIPNVIWMAVPQSDDIFREESITPILDGIAAVCQALMVLALCFCIRKEPVRFCFRSTGVVLTVLFVGLYYLAWVFDYVGMVNDLIVLSLALFPCFAFISYLFYRKNWIGMIPAVIFSCCHVIFALVNFIV